VTPNSSASPHLERHAKMANSPLDLMNQSGFPLQAATRLAVETTQGWSVLGEEHAWQDPEKDGSAFADLIARHVGRRITLVIECKKKKDATWCFLVHDDKTCDQTRHKILHRKVNEDKIDFAWHEAYQRPGAYSSMYCVVRGGTSDQKGHMLENIASELVRATEAIAAEEILFLQKHQDFSDGIYIPVIVTTASLSVVKYQNSSLDIINGVLDEGVIESVDWIRLEKQLTHTTTSRAHDANETQFAQGKERAVYVVRSEKFASFLEQCVFQKLVLW
jgi:hypothetical protein